MFARTSHAEVPVAWIAAMSPVSLREDGASAENGRGRLAARHRLYLGLAFGHVTDFFWPDHSLAMIVLVFSAQRSVNYYTLRLEI